MWKAGSRLQASVSSDYYCLWNWIMFHIHQPEMCVCACGPSRVNTTEQEEVWARVQRSRENPDALWEVRQRHQCHKVWGGEGKQASWVSHTFLLISLLVKSAVVTFYSILFLSCRQTRVVFIYLYIFWHVFFPRIMSIFLFILLC